MSIKHMWRGLFRSRDFSITILRMNIWSTVDRFERKPACSSSSCLSRRPWTRLRICEFDSIDCSRSCSFQPTNSSIIVQCRWTFGLSSTWSSKWYTEALFQAASRWKTLRNPSSYELACYLLVWLYFSCLFNSRCFKSQILYQSVEIWWLLRKMCSTLINWLSSELPKKKKEESKHVVDYEWIANQWIFFFSSASSCFFSKTWCVRISSCQHCFISLIIFCFSSICLHALSTCMTKRKHITLIDRRQLVLMHLSVDCSSSLYYS